MSSDANVVVVGAGPIGLAYALGIKKLNPDLKVVVLEKYEEFQRKHTLVMQYEQLEKFMYATGIVNDEVLSRLLKHLKQDPHIRTNVLQATFKQLAMDCGVEVITEEVKKPTIQSQIFENYPKVQLIIGADGTHSVVSDALFPEGNQIKHEFDYVLQMRYEIEGEDKSEGVDSISFYQQMARQGVIANEYVGHFENGKTPVTMQLMISKKDFETLKAATSKNPTKPFADKRAMAEHPVEELPANIGAFINKYLLAKIKNSHKNGEKIDRNSIRISVNEAPATHAKQVFHVANNIPVTLAGDAGLGLSYFKGLNAGLESTAKFFETMRPVITHSFSDKNATEIALNEYQDWFVQDFSPKKVKEVAQYSTWRIRSGMFVMKAVRDMKMKSEYEFEEEQREIINDYFDLLAQDPLGFSDSEGNWRAFPHREYDPVKYGQFEDVPVKHTLKKITKQFVDYIKPYKSTFQVKQDFKQPVTGVVNIFVGIIKLATGLWNLDGKRLADGFFCVLRGIIEITTTPLTWFVKPVMRGLASWIHGPVRIEDGLGIRALAEYGKKCVSELQDTAMSPKKVFELLAVCNDVHRKFDKSIQRSESSLIKEIDEYSCYSALGEDTHLSCEKLNNYLSLFCNKPSVPPNVDETFEINSLAR